MANPSPLRCVLFDLDGCLLDTAPDLVYACNTALAEAGLPPQSLEALKPQVSGGALAMLQHSLASHAESVDLDGLLQRMLEFYENHIAVHTRFFSGMDTVLEELERRGLAWGVVTNKTSRFTDPLLSSLGLAQRAGCVISGDTTAQAKPHPLPMWEACKRIGVEPQECVYIGDARRDIEAGKNAGMATLAALYGYIPAHDPAIHWGADGCLETPLDLLAWLEGKCA
jgi:phosphoglycolate phosphatase